MSPRILTATIATLLLRLPAFAVTDAWDGNSPNGGVGDSNITTGLNWADDSAPVSDLINTDLVFGGTTKLAPNFNTVFSTDSITFINTAGAFILGGLTITIGTTGIANTDAQTQTINNNVTLGTASTSFQAINGSLLFFGTLALGTNSLSVSGAQATTLAGAITGTGTINKSGAGTLTLSNTTIAADVNISGGVVNVGSAGTTTFNSNSTIDINSGTFDAAGNVTLDNAQLIRDNGATLSIAAAKTLTIQNGADATITGAFTNSTASTITVTGSGSTFTTTSNVALNGGARPISSQVAALPPGRAQLISGQMERAAR
jgi:autotransporter-associated beta strand protein